MFVPFAKEEPQNPSHATAGPQTWCGTGKPLAGRLLLCQLSYGVTAGGTRTRNL